MRLLLATLASGLLLAPAAHAQTDLGSIAPAGIAGSDTATLSAAGDVNGDGIVDVVSGLQGDVRNPASTSLSDVAVIGFTPASLDPSRPGFSGLVLSHLNEPVPKQGYIVGGGVAGVGDWDGDGLDDVAVAVAGAAPHGRAEAGSVYVVLGRREGGDVDVRTDPRVVRIDGPERSSQIGFVLGAAGDVDGDGRPDLAIGLAGDRAVIVRGGAPAGTPIDLAKPPVGATIELRGLDGGTPNAAFEGGRTPVETAAFAPLGDLDGDGRGELLVGVPAVDPLRGRGRAFVVRGAAGGAIVDASQPSGRLAHVVGPQGVPGFGTTVAAIPDSDGDGHPEWGIGAPLPSNVFTSGRTKSGAYLVFSGARGEVRPGKPGQPVAEFDAAARGAHAGRTLAGIPDATGDGVPDLLLGLPDVSPHCRAGAGAVALVPGRATPGRTAVGARTPRIDGPSAGTAVGERFAVVGGDVFLGVRPFENSARQNLWRLPLSTFAPGQAALPVEADCLRVTITKRSRAQLERTGQVTAQVRSNAGDGRAHRLKLQSGVIVGRKEEESRTTTVRVPASGTVRVTLKLSRQAVALLAAATRKTFVFVTAEQMIGTGPEATTGAFGDPA